MARTAGSAAFKLAAKDGQKKLTAKDQRDLFERAVCLQLRLGRPGVRRRVKPKEELKIDGEDFLDGVKAPEAAPETPTPGKKRGQMHTHKDILDSPELRAVIAWDSQIRDAYLQTRCLPSDFREGIYLLPVDLIEEVDAKLTEMLAHRTALVEEFIAALEQRKEEARAALGKQFRESDYLTPAAYREQFEAGYRYIEPPGTPKRLRSVSATIANRELAKARVWAEEARANMGTALRLAAKDLVDHFVERMTPDADGKPKRFKESTITNLMDFLETFGKRNLADDDQMQKLVEQARRAMTGVSRKQLAAEDATDLRASMLGKFERIKGTLDKLVVRGRRAFEE